ncbi:MAG: hypothetical protein HQK51_14810, partial [Oligoflexia bacterium]|nr:hypothetical protein [Oligoflexia bacterium]
NSKKNSKNKNNLSREEKFDESAPLLLDVDNDLDIELSAKENDKDKDKVKKNKKSYSYDDRNASEGNEPFILDGSNNNLTKLSNEKNIKNSDPNNNKTYILPEMNNGKSNLDTTKKSKQDIINDLISEQGHLMDSGGTNLSTENLQTFYRKIEDKSKYNFSFIVFKDRYNYSSNNDVFNKIFRDDKNSELPVILQLSQLWTLQHWDGLASFDYGFNIGIGYNSGKGIFVNEERSDIIFYLWDLPFDIVLGYELYLFRFVKVGVFAGPSAMMLTQKRSDSRRKPWLISFGYFDSANVRFNLTPLFINSFSKFYKQYSITSFYLNFIYRQQEYKNFRYQDEIQIKGSSFGAGFSFDYL